MKEPARRTKFIPRVGNWENQAKRHSAAFYGDKTPPGLRSRAVGKEGTSLLSRRIGEDAYKRDPTYVPTRDSPETARVEKQVTRETTSVRSSPTAVRAKSAGVASREQSQEEHAVAPVNARAVEQQAWTARATEVSDKLSTAVRAVTDETAQLEKDIAGYVLDFEGMVSAHSRFIQQIDEQLAALLVDESAINEAAAAAAASEQATSPGTAVAGGPASAADAKSEKGKLTFTHTHPSEKRSTTATAQGSQVKPPFYVKKVPSKWAAAGRRKAGL